VDPSIKNSGSATMDPYLKNSKISSYDEREERTGEEQVEASGVAAAACARDGGAREREVGDGGVRERENAGYAAWRWYGWLRGHTASTR
jgi:hypothetical protein